ncbi:MAG: rhodoquinone biosynthesis methyltransferase RquA [Sedimenticola sp.]
MDQTSPKKYSFHTRENSEEKIDIPRYLKETYWWAYLHPNAIRVFERQWLVNSILWGNYRRLRDAVLSEIHLHFQGKILQLACVYGDLTEKVASKLSLKGQLDLVDISQSQLDNALAKLGKRQNLNLYRQDTSSLSLPDNKYDVTLLFFLLHEQPENIRRATLSEAIRVTRSGGKIIIVDYHLASAWNPLKYLMEIVFRKLEPFAKGFIAQEVSALLPSDTRVSVEKYTYFGDLYQKIILKC